MQRDPAGPADYEPVSLAAFALALEVRVYLTSGIIIRITS
jgi:hypothetical protein